MKKKWIKTIAALLIAFGIIGGGYYGYNKYYSKSASAAKGLTFSPVKATRGNIDVSITASGAVTCASQYDIATASSGIIDSLNFKEGDKVSKGDILAKINDSSAEKNVKSSEVTLQQKNNDLNKLQKSLSTVYVPAPADGRVKSLNPQSGDDLSNLKALGPVAVISRDGQMKVSVDVPAGSDASSVVTKDEAVDIDVNGQTVQGTVTSTNVARDINTEKSIQADQVSLNEKNVELDKLQKNLDSLYVKAPVAGKVKSVIGQAGDDVANLKAAGPLMYINKDGKMKITINVDAGADANTIVIKDDIVNIYIGDNCIGRGKVLSNTVQVANSSAKVNQVTTSGTVVIEMDRDDFPINSEVRVEKTNGSDIVVGKGTLSLSDPVSIQPTSGIIGEMYVAENTVVNKGDNLFKYNEDDIKSSIASKKQEIQQLQNELSNLKNNISANQSGSAATSGTNSGSILVTIPRDDLPVNATVTVKKHNGSGTVIGTGNLAINDPVPITISSGIVDNVYVSENSMVKRGDNLFKLNGDDIQVSIDSKGLEIQQAQLDLNNNKTILQKNILTSPIDGIIAAVNFNKGDNAASNKVVATVLDPSQMQVVVAVDELDIAKVKVGEKAKVALDAIAGKNYEGEVSKIATLGKTTNGVTTYDVTISVKNADKLKVGMTANVSISVQSKENVILLPAAAVQNGKGGKTVITEKALQSSSDTKENNKNVKTSADLKTVLQNDTKQVQTGIANDENIEITSGVKEGEVVLIPITGSAFQNQRTVNPFNSTNKSNTKNK